MLPTMTIFLTISSGLFILVTCPQQCFIVFLVWSVAVLLKRIMQDYETGHLFVVDFGASILTAVCLWYSWSETSEFVKCIIVFGLILLMVVFERDNALGRNVKLDNEVEAESMASDSKRTLDKESEKHENQEEDHLEDANAGDCGGYNGGYGNVDGYRRSKGELNVEIESQDTMTDVQQKKHEYVDNMHIMDGSQGDECGVVSTDEVVVTDTHIEGTATTQVDAESTDGSAIDSDVEERDKGKGKHENRDVIYTREADVRSHDVLHEDEKKSTYVETMNTAHTVHGGMGHKMNVTDSNVTAPLLSNISGQPSIYVHMENVANGQMLKASEQEMQSKDEADTYVEGQETEDSKPAQDVDDKGQQIKNNNDLCDDDAVDGTYNDVVDDEDDEDDDGDGDEEDDVSSDISCISFSTGNGHPRVKFRL